MNKLRLALNSVSESKFINMFTELAIRTDLKHANEKGTCRSEVELAGSLYLKIYLRIKKKGDFQLLD